MPLLQHHPPRGERAGTPRGLCAIGGLAPSAGVPLPSYRIGNHPEALLALGGKPPSASTAACAASASSGRMPRCNYCGYSGPQSQHKQSSRPRPDESFCARPAPQIRPPGQVRNRQPRQRSAPPGQLSQSRSVIAATEATSGRRRPLADSVLHAYGLGCLRDPESRAAGPG